MKLTQLLIGAGYSNHGIADAEVSLVTEDSRKVCPGSIFVCVQGARFDGHDMASDAVEAGAVLIVAQRDTGAPNQLIVSDTREAFSLLSASFYSNPARKLRLVGVTGTNGKTTTCFMLKSVFEALGHKTGLVGTVKNMVGDVEYPAHLTTPDPFELNGLFAKMVDAGCEFCVMEVSSQALAQQRVAGLHYETAIFTNLVLKITLLQSISFLSIAIQPLSTVTMKRIRLWWKVHPVRLLHSLPQAITLIFPLKTQSTVRTVFHMFW